MSTDPGSTSADIPPAAADVASELPNALGYMDTLAVQRLQTLQLVQQGRLSRVSRTLADAQTKSPPDSQALQAAQAAVAATAATVGRISMAQQQAATTDPAVAQEGWALHGRVFDSQLQPASGFTVFMVDSQKAYQPAAGFAYTDATGYFLLNFAGSKTAATSQSAPEASGARASRRPTPTPSTGQTAPNASVPQLFLAVANSKAQPVYLSDAAFQPVTGSPTYQNVVLAPGNQPIGDPPKEIRNIALPKGTKRRS